MTVAAIFLPLQKQIYVTQHCYILQHIKFRDGHFCTYVGTGKKIDVVFGIYFSHSVTLQTRLQTHKDTARSLPVSVSSGAERILPAKHKQGNFFKFGNKKSWNRQVFKRYVVLYCIWTLDTVEILQICSEGVIFGLFTIRYIIYNVSFFYYIPMFYRTKGLYTLCLNDVNIQKSLHIAFGHFNRKISQLVFNYPNCQSHDIL